MQLSQNVFASSFALLKASMSEARNIANINNAQHSTGPRTEEGKAASSLNSLKHGLTAKTVLLPGEDPALFESGGIRSVAVQITPPAYTGRKVRSQSGLSLQVEVVQ